MAGDGVGVGDGIPLLRKEGLIWLVGLLFQEIRSWQGKDEVGTGGGHVASTVKKQIG